MPDRWFLHDAITQAADPLALMERIVAQALVLVPGADGASFEVPRDDESLEYVSAAGTLAGFVGLRLPIHSSLSGLAARTGRIARTDDAREDPRVNREAVQRTGVISMLCVPVSGGRVGTSVLKVSSRRPEAFTGADVSSLERLAGFMSATLAAAAELAGVTADLLGREGHEAAAHPAGDAPVEEAAAGEGASDGAAMTTAVARFVANVMSPGLVEDAEAGERISELLATRGIRMVVQPIVRLATDEVVSLEALARFPGDLLRGPERWFADARRVGMVVDLELLAVEEALGLMPDLPEGVHLSVNVGPEALIHPRFAQLLAGARLDRLTLELTEHARFADYGTLLDATRRLREDGVRLSIDDTGAGYSSLSHILRMRPDVIKLDRDLTAGIEDDLVRQSLATALMTFATGIGASVVAEGIETEAARQRLMALGVRYGQGYLLGRPAPLAS